MRKPTIDQYCWAFVTILMGLSLLFLFRLTSLINWATQ